MAYFIQFNCTCTIKDMIVPDKFIQVHQESNYVGTRENTETCRRMKADHKKKTKKGGQGPQ